MNREISKQNNKNDNYESKDKLQHETYDSR